MQTLYTKMSRERDPKFQQMTKIYIEDGERKVSKTSLTQMGQKHIEDMYANFTYFQTANKNVLCPTKYKDKSLIFDYLTGESLCSQLLKCIENKDRDAFISLLYVFKQFVYNFGDEKELFSITNEYRNVFGDAIPKQTVGAKHLNIDLIFENLINLKESYVAIDYEWIFKFVIPYEFVFYRAIFSFFIKYSSNIGTFIDINTVYDLFGITKVDTEVFHKMDQNFLKYVNGIENNYDSMLLNYKKESYDVKEIVKKKVLHTELYYDLGNGFNAELKICKDIDVKENDVIEVEYNLPVEVKNLRFDPSTNAISILLYDIILVDKKNERISIDSYIHNASDSIDRYLVFDHTDSQILISEIQDIISIKFIFKFLTDSPVLNDEEKLVFNIINAKNVEINKMRNQVLKSDKLISIYKEIIKELRVR